MEVSTTTNILNAGLRRNTSASELLNTDTFGIGNSLRVTSFNTSQSSSLNASIQQDNDNNVPVNAFGIGRANQPDVQLSPQARILQQNDANQRALAEGLQEARDAVRDTQEETVTVQSPAPDASVATLETEAPAPEPQTSTTNLQAQRATSLYQSVQSFT